MFRSARAAGREEVSTRVVVTFSGVPRLGGRVIGGRTDCGVVEAPRKVSRMRAVMRLVLPGRRRG